MSAWSSMCMWMLFRGGGQGQQTTYQCYHKETSAYVSYPTSIFISTLQGLPKGVDMGTFFFSFRQGK